MCTRQSMFPGLYIAAITAAVMGLIPLRNWETWWHLSMGRIIEEFRAVPAANHTTFGVPEETPSLLHAWLAERAMHLIDATLALEGLLTARNLLLFLALAIALQIPRALTLRIRLAASALGAALAACATFATPAIFAAPLFSITLLCVWRLGRHGRPRWQQILAMLTPVACTALWANLDIAYGLIPLLTAFAAVHAFTAPLEEGESEEENRFRAIGWSVSTIASLLAPLLNPRGVELIPHTVDVLLSYPLRTDVVQWTHLFTASTWFELSLTLAAVAGGIALARHINHKSLISFIFLSVTLLFFAVTHLRAMMWLGLSLPLLADLLYDAPQGEEERAAAPQSRIKRTTLCGGALLLALLTQPLFIWRPALIAPLASVLDVRDRMPHQYTVERELPVEAIALLKNSSHQPRVWASPRYEGLIQYHLLEPSVEQVTFTDPRIEMFPDDVLALRELMREDKDLWRGIFQGYDIRAALLHTAEDTQLIDTLIDHPDWQRAHQQGDTHLFVLVKAVR